MKTFLKCSQKVHVHKIEDRKPSGTVGIRGTVGMYGNSQINTKRYLKKGYPFVFLSLYERYLIMDKLIELKIDGELAFASAQKWYYT